MNNRVDDLLAIIKRGVQIASSEDDEQFIKDAMIEADKVVTKFSKKDWKNLITKLPIEKNSSCDYTKIKDESLRSIIENEDCATAFMINDRILEIIIKNAPNDIKPLAIEMLYQHSKNNKAEILKSKTCGCFYCKKIFASSDIKNWIEKENTALCPYCTVDAVLGDASGVEITNKLLDEMNKMYF